MCGSHARLTCRILVYGSRLYTDFRLISLKFLNYSNFPYNLFSHKISHFMQFSLAEYMNCACYTMCCSIVNTKRTGNALSIHPAACSQQLLRETNFPQVAISLLVWSFHPMM